MSKLKFNPNQFLGSHEFNRMWDFIVDNGYKELLKSFISKYGVVNDYVNDQGFDNLRVKIGTAFNKLTLMTGSAIDADINRVTVSEEVVDFLELPADGEWRYITIKYDSTDIEVGEVSIDVNGDITGVGTKFTEVLRGQPNHPIKVKFKNASLNTGEFEVLEVISDTQAKLNGYQFDAESNLELSIVGTFAPHITVADESKYIYQYDSYELSVLTQTEVDLIDKTKEFILASAKDDSGTVSLRDLRALNLLTLNVPEDKPITTTTNEIIGLERVSWGGKYKGGGVHDLRFGWGLVSEENEWSVDSQNSTITLSGAKGGIMPNLDNVETGFLNNWRVYFEDGSCSRIFASNKSGSTMVLTMRAIDNQDLEGKLHIVPDADWIVFDLRFNTSAGDSYNAVNKEFSFPISLASGIASIPYIDGAIGLYYKLKNGKNETEFKVVNPGDYLQEDSFDGDGEELDPVAHVIEPVVFGHIDLVKNPDNHYDYKAWIHKPNTFTAIQKFGTGVTIDNSSKLIEIGDDGNTFTVDVVNSEVIGILGKEEGTEINLFFNDVTLLKQNQTLTAAQVQEGYLPLDLPLDSDFDITTTDPIKLIQNKDKWRLLVIPSSIQLPASAPPLGGIIMWSGPYDGNWDTSGKGISVSNGTSGWALCNGNNGTEDLRGRFIVGAINNMPSVGSPELADEVNPEEGNIDYKIGDKGGLADVTLTKGQIPPHTHEPGTIEIADGGEHGHNIGAGDGGGDGELIDSTDGSELNQIIADDATHSHPTTDFSGVTEDGSADGLKGESHTNLPPYYSLAYIKRIA